MQLLTHCRYCLFFAYKTHSIRIYIHSVALFIHFHNKTPFTTNNKKANITAYASLAIAKNKTIKILVPIEISNIIF